jgi:ParB family chromosome partitioning protein
MIERQKLGKGLSVLIRQNTLDTEEKSRDFIELELSRIVPNKYQPRIEFNSIELEELAASIQLNGVIQPIMVRSKGANQYELVAG